MAPIDLGRHLRRISQVRYQAKDSRNNQQYFLVIRKANLSHELRFQMWLSQHYPNNARAYGTAIESRKFLLGAAVEHAEPKWHDVLSEETLNGVQVHRVGGTISEGLRRWLKTETPQSVSESAERGLPGKRTRSGLGSLIKTVYDLTWKKIYWPESTCLWFFPAREKALKLASDIPFDAVISTSTPYTGHLVGKTVKIAHPDMPWTVDIGDPFSFGQPPWNNTGLYKKLNYRSEAKVLKAADSISVTVDSCKKAYGQLFSGVEDKITVIPPLFSGAIPSYQKKPNTQKRCQLVFTGSLYKEIL
jgi:hypothetical protein